MHTTINDSEVQKFNALAHAWWDKDGQFRALHAMNPCRLDYITRKIAHNGLMASLDHSRRPLHSVRILDVGCGGGLLAEPLARLGAQVCAIDAAVDNINAARAHAQKHNLTIDYRCITIEDIVQDKNNAFDVVLSMEIIEHIANPALYMQACADMLRPGGIVITSTLNRSAQSFVLAIALAEYVLHWLPKGTHDWNAFIKPRDLLALAKQAGLHPIEQVGFVYSPLCKGWRVSKNNLSVNYCTVCQKPIPNAQ